MKNDFELNLSNLINDYSHFYKLLNRQVNICFFIMCMFVIFSAFALRIAITYSFFWIISLSFFTIAIACLIVIIKNMKKIKVENSNYENAYAKLQKEAYETKTKIVSSFQDPKNIKINRINIICIAIIILITYFSFKIVKDYSLEKWINQKVLRPYMIEDFGYYQRSINYDETKGDKLNYPDLLRSYTREELTTFFYSDKKKSDPNKDIIISYTDTYNGDFILDTHYSFSDPFGKDYWVLIFYQKRDEIFVFSYAEVKPSGTKVELSEYSFKFL